MPPVAYLPVIAMSPVAAFATAASLCLLIGGLVLLFLGIKLIRSLLTMVFATLGGIVGQVVGMMTANQVTLPGWPWVAAIGGAVVCGLVGLLLYRIWVVLTFGVLLSAGAAAGLLVMTGGDEFAHARSDSLDLAGGVGDLFVFASDAYETIQQDPSNANEVTELLNRLVSFTKGESQLTPEQSKQLSDLLAKNGKEQNLKDRLARMEGFVNELPERMKTLGGEWRDLLAHHGVPLSIAAIVGLAVGLLLAGLNWRLAAVLMTSLAGLGLTIGALYVFASFQQRDWLDRVAAMGWKAWFGVAGLWLMGASAQGLLARRKKAPPAQQPPAEPAK